jgi:hypothetical protein
MASREGSARAYHQIFQKTRDCQSIAGFLLNLPPSGAQKKEKQKYEYKKQTSADRIRAGNPV